MIAAVLVLGGGDDDEQVAAGEIFLEPAAEVGPDPFGTDLEGEALDVTTTTVSTTATSAAPTSAPVQATPSVSGGQRGLYGGTRNAATCDPQQQADFLAANPTIAAAFVAALNADPTLRWSGGTDLAVDDIEPYLLELTPVNLTADTRVTNHGYADGRATPRQAVLQAGTAVLVDAYGVPRVKCACGNPLTAPTPVQATPSYTGPRWSGFSPDAVVVVTETRVEVEVYVLVDVETGEPFGRPAGTTGDDDVDAPDPDDTTATTEDPDSTAAPTTETTGTTATTAPPTTTGTGDQATFCSMWQGYIDQYGEVDPSLPEVVTIFDELTAAAPPEIQPQMVVLRDAVRDAAASGSTDISDVPGVEPAMLGLLAYLQGTCGFQIMP